MTVVQILLLALLGLLLVVAGVGDLRARLISNRLNLAIAALAIGWWLASGLSPTGIAVRLAAAGIVFAVFAAIFAAGLIGGGDVKLLAALALWLPPTLLVKMLVLMVLAGGLLSVATLAWHKARRAEGAAEVPYGVAIAGATLFVMANDLLTIRGA